MKLIDFNKFLKFNRIREKMEIPKDYKPDFTGVDHISIKMKFEEIKTKGLDISPEELEMAADGTLEHREFPGQKMLVYIRDFNGDYVKNESNMLEYPRFHIAWCSTLDGMFSNKKYNRYVVSQRKDGNFLLNIISGGKVVKKDMELKLHICKNCLTKLNYNGYNEYGSAKSKIFDSFNVEDFLKQYNTEIHISPIHNEKTQPVNEYTDDWEQLSYNYRKSKNFICQDCGKDCSGDTAELHVHHIDGVKSNNLPSNLEVVCVKCHAKKYRHDHLRNSKKWDKYLK